MWQNEEYLNNNVYSEKLRIVFIFDEGPT